MVKALHVEANGPDSDTIAKHVKAILKRRSFNRFKMTGNIRLVPQYILNQGETDKNMKIKKCIIIQSQFQAQLSSEKVLDLEIIDRKITWLNNKTLRENC